MDRDLYFTRTACIFKFRHEELFRLDYDFLRFPTWSPCTAQKQQHELSCCLKHIKKGMDVASKYLCNPADFSFHRFLWKYLGLIGICRLGRSCSQSWHAAWGMKTGQRAVRSDEVPKEVWVSVHRLKVSAVYSRCGLT